MLAAMLLFVSGCSEQPAPEQTPVPTATQARPFITPTPAPSLTTNQAGVLGGVETDQLVVSIVFEGTAEEAVLESIFSVLEKQDVSGLFFVDGTTAYEHPDAVRLMAENGHEIGNAGMSMRVHMDQNTTAGNVHQFERTQQLIYSACGKTPTLACLSASQSTAELLQAVTASGLYSLVQPDIYINKNSFLENEEVVTFVESLVRGSIISIQVGSEEGDYETATAGLAEEKSIDMPSTVSKLTEEVEPDLHIAEILTWLIEALKLNHYTVVTPVELQDMQTALLGDAYALSPGVAERYSVAHYAVPVPDADSPLGTTVTRIAQTGDFSGTVFVGDSIMANLMSYVTWCRETDETFWDDAQFLVTSKLTLEKALIADEGAPVLPMVEEQRIHIDDALYLLGARRVYLCLRAENIRAYSEKRYLNNMKILIHQIQERCPDIEVIVLSVPPAISARTSTPSNMQIFQYNLMVCQMCQTHGIAFLDWASVLRNEKGALRDEYCLDPDSYGTHLNDAGCQALLNYLNENIP